MGKGESDSISFSLIKKIFLKLESGLALLSPEEIRVYVFP